MKNYPLFYLLLTVPVFLTGRLSAQPEYLRFTHGCNYDHRLEEREYFTNTPSTQANNILEELCIALSIDRSSIILKSANVSNAVATRIEGKRYILYSSEFLARAGISEENRWAVYSILAHEIGHHILGHNFEIDDPGLRKLFELEADRFSGRMLRNLCADDKEALLAMNLISNAQAEGYPILSARRDAVSSGWEQQHQDLSSSNRRDPCDVETIIEPTFGRNYNKNLARDVRGHVGEKSLRFQFNVQDRPGKSDFRTFIVLPPNSNLTPSQFEWLTPSNSTGPNRELIWHFSEQELEKGDVILPDKLGIAVFEERHIPRAVHWSEFAYSGLMVVGGSVAVGIGKGDINEATDLYDNTYNQIRNENDAVYQGDNPSRSELLREINSQNMRGQVFRNVGYGLILGGAFCLWQKWRKHKRSRIGLLYDGQAGIGIRITPEDPNSKFYR